MVSASGAGTPFPGVRDSLPATRKEPAQHSLYERRHYARVISVVFRFNPVVWNRQKVEFSLLSGDPGTSAITTLSVTLGQSDAVAGREPGEVYFFAFLPRSGMKLHVET